MDPHRPSFPNPPGNTRFPPPFYPPPNPHHHNHHQHHHYQQLPPPPRLPPPPPPHIPHRPPISLPPPPPPPNSFHHHPGHGSHQFANPPHRGRHQQPLDPNLAPHHRNHSHNQNNRLDFSQPPPRVTDRLVYDDDRRNRPPPPSRGFDDDPYRRPIDGPAAWNTPPRVPFDAPPPPPPIARRISRGGFDREPPPYRPSLQPVVRFRNDQDGGSRVRKEFSSDNWFRADELPRERRDNFMNNDNFHRDRRFEREIDRDIHRNEFVSTTAEQFSGLVPQEELIRKGRGDVVDENLRWDHLPRGAPYSPTPTDSRSRAIDSGNGFYEKGKIQVLDSDRLGDRDRWEDAQDFNLTPRKKQKRKNALLRLEPGIPSLRNSYERSPSLCRDREPSQLPDHKPVKERERSPIVSFKSNLLIVAPSSSGAVADDLSAFGDDKNRNEVMGNKYDLVSPSNVVEKAPSKIDSDNHCGNGSCTLGEQEMHLEKKTKPPTYPRKVKPSVSHDLPVANAEATSNKAECLSEDKTLSKSPNGKLLGKSYAVSGSGKELSPNFRKKRKSTNPNSSVSSLQVLKTDSESVSMDNLVNSSSSESMLGEGLKDSGKVLPSAIMATKPTEVTAIGSSKTVDEKRAVDSVSVGTSAPKLKRRKIVKPHPRTSRQSSGKPDLIPVNVIGPIQGGQTISNSDGAVNKILPSAIMATKPTEVTAIGSSKTVDEKRAVDSVSVGTSAPKLKRRKIVKPHPRTSRQSSGKPDLIPVNVIGPIQGGQTISNSDGAVNKILPSAIMATKPTEVTAIGSSKTVDEKRAVDSVSVGTSAPKLKRRKIVKPRPRTSRQSSGKPDEIPVNVIGPIQGGQTISNFDGAVNKIQNGSSLDAVVNDSSNICLDVVSVPHQQGFAEGSSGATSSVKRFIPFQISTRSRTTQSRTTKFDIIKIGCANVLSASDSMNSSVRQLNCSKSGVTDSALSSGDVSAGRHNKINFADIVKGASQSKTSSSKNGAIEEYMNTKPSEQDSKSTTGSSSEEFRISEIPDVSCCKEAVIHAADIVVSKNSEQLTDGSDGCIVNDVSKLSCMDRLPAATEVGVNGGFSESETMKTDLSLFPAEGSVTKNDRKRKGSELRRGSGKISADGVTLTLGRSIDSDFVQDKIAGSEFTCPDAQLKLCIGDCISMNGSEEKTSSQETGIPVNPSVNAYPSEVLTSTCNKRIKVLASHLGSSHTTTHVICEKSAYSDALSCGADVPPHSIQALPLSSAEVGMSVSELASPSDLALPSTGLDLNYCNDGSPLVSADLKLVEEACGKESSNFVLPGTANVFDIPDEKQTSSLSESTSLPQGDGTLLMTGAIDGYCGAGVESGSERSICNRSVAGESSSQNQCTDQNISHPESLVRDLERDINIPVKDDLSSLSKSSPMMDNASLVDSPENLSATASLEVFDVPNLNGKPVGKRANGKSTFESCFFSPFSNPSTLNNIVNFKMARDGFVNSSVKTMPFVPASQSAKEVLQSSSNEGKKQTIIKNELNLPSSKALSSRSSSVPSSGRGHTTVIKSRTWHRTDNPTSKPPVPNSSTRFVPRQKQPFSHTTRAQSNSYVRKGNSLLRNPATAVSQQSSTSAPAISVVQLNLSASVDAKNSPCEMPEKVTSPCNIDSSDCDLAAVGDSRCSPVSDSSMAAENGSQRFPEDMPKSPVNSEIQSSKSFEDLGALNHINHSRRMVYIKHKSNQLVAAPNSSTEMSAASKDLPALMSDIYFKRKKNQLVRATVETHSQQISADPDDGSNSEGRRVVKSCVGRSATKKYPNRVSRKTPKSCKFSLVWKLCNTQSPKKGVNSVRCQQVLPHLLPWKRATYWKSLFRTSADLFKNSPLSHKLASSRKRHIIYKRSGFSLRRSKVVSLAGSSLKWSISLERRSTKVDKEAKLAVAALEKGKREKNSVPNSAGIESKNNSSHEEHSASGTGHQVKNVLKPSVPRRRLIGNDEYVRIGNGNQLIRNPKRRTRILASEKVRWSLHTARRRLAKKRKYCQFFTRFGKCNKEEGKCPYIHDPSKNAICTKFLNGLCSDPKCKLTHKVIPERMPDCSFFLQGTCSNESCPYRHVSVNPKAAICGNFLKGYCAEGNECRKKHSYSCPVYEATGECPEGSRCKLYHSRKGKDKKGKKTRERRKARSSGRYFGSRPATGNTEPETEGCGKRIMPKDDSIILEDGSLADFISLDASDEENGDQEDEANQETNPSDGEQPSFISDDLDELIKPIRLLRIMSQAAEGRVLND